MSQIDDIDATDERVLRVLRRRGGGELRVAEIARELDLDRGRVVSAVHRLVVRGYLVAETRSDETVCKLSVDGREVAFSLDG